LPDAALISSILLELEITVLKYVFGLVIAVKIQRTDNQLVLQGLGSALTSLLTSSQINRHKSTILKGFTFVSSVLEASITISLSSRGLVVSSINRPSRKTVTLMVSFKGGSTQDTVTLMRPRE